MSDPADRTRRDALYDEAVASLGAALERLVRGYSRDPDFRRDLLQEIHVAIWRSLAGFDGRCSLRTWVYRVAHNRAISLALRSRSPARFVGLDEVEPGADRTDAGRAFDERRAMDRISALIQTLKPIDREVILLYLEDLDAAAIGEITGLAPGNVATKIHRIKRLLVERFYEGSK